MSDSDWEAYKTIIANNMLVQARCGLLTVLQKRAEPHVYIKYQNSTWRIDRIEPGEKIPIWATRGWIMFNDNPKEDHDKDLNKLAVEWSYFQPTEETPGNPLSTYTGISLNNNHSLPILVFGKV